jgi:2,3-diketo-5-methylthio-1-phosphopentane phosphatase
MTAQPIRVFCDFDGTISARDVGATVFNHLSAHKNSGTVKLWINQKIDSRECLLRECAYLKASREEILAEVAKIDLMGGFKEFAELMKTANIPMHVVSDGLDFYISAFLQRFGLGDLDVHCNHAHFINGALHPSFPYFVDGCGLCGTCKGERIRSLSSEGELCVYIGDGFSDRCAVGEADLLFARDDLVSVAREKGVDWIDYDDFFDVIKYFESNLLRE